MHAPNKYFEKGLSVAAKGAWTVFSALNKIGQNPSFTPKWSDKPLQKSYQKTKPPLGWPRETDSLCPVCTREARQEIVDGKKDVSVLLNEKVGEIKATILERDGKILMVKDCPLHGHFEDVMAIDTDFFKHLEQVFPGRDMRAHNDDDHVIAVFKRHGCYGCVAKSNTTVLRYREPIYRTLRELVLSFFDFYYNLNGDKALRSYTRTIDLRVFNHLEWLRNDDALTPIADRLDVEHHYPLVTEAQIAEFAKVEGDVYRAGLLGADADGLYKPT